MFFTKIYGGLFYMGLTNDQIILRERGDFTNAFSSYLDNVNLKIFPSHGEIET